MAWTSADQNPTTAPSAGLSGPNYAASLNSAAYYNPMGSGTTMAPAAAAGGAAGGSYADRLGAAAGSAPAPMSTSQALAASAKGPPRTNAPTRAPDPVAEARRYLTSVANPGGSMSRQGINQAIARLRPDVAVGLASDIQRARAEGIPASPFSAYRDPHLDPGGYRDKFNSLHGMTTATDVSGIGTVGSRTARRYYEIAQANGGMVNPYGPNNPDEFNHYQFGSTKGRQFRNANPQAEVALRSYLAAGSPVFNPPNPNLSPRTSPAYGAAGARGPMPNDYPEPTGRGYEPAPELAALWQATGYNGEAGTFEGEPMVASAGQDAMAGGTVPVPRTRPERTGGASTAYAPAPERMEEPFRAVVRPQPQRQAAPQDGGAYTVRRGDNLTAISKRFGVSVQDIARANGIRNPDLIRGGQRLVIPGQAAAAPAPRPQVDVPQPRMRPSREVAMPTPPTRPDMRIERYPGGAPDAGAVPQPRMRPGQPAPASPPPAQDFVPITDRIRPDVERTSPADIGWHVSQFRSQMMRDGVPQGPALDRAVRIFEQKMQERASRGQPAGPGMDTSGLIREPTAEERALQGQPMPMPTGPQPMDPMVQRQINRTPVVITDPLGLEPGGPPFVASNGISIRRVR